MKISLRPKVAQPLLATALAALVAFGCTDQGSEPPTSPVVSPDLSARAGQSLASQQDLGPALAAQKRHGPQLMAIPGVVGHGVGVDDDGNPTITVFTLQPGVSGIPARLDDVPTRTVVSGQFVAGGTTDKTSPAPNGYSVGHPNITAGTLGVVVKDAANVCYILSNNHVLANSNKAAIGDNTLQPGPFDGGQDPEDAIATLSAFEPIAFDGSANTIDAAIAELISPTFVMAETPAATGYGAPGTTPVGASVGQQLQKFGRTTLLTDGQVTEIEVTANVCYECAGPFCFGCKKLAFFTDLVATEDMSGGGDSGSLTVTDDSNKNPVGLLFAGSSMRTLHNRIDFVLNRFNVDIETNISQCATDGGEPPPDPVTDIAVTAVSAPASVTQGNVVDVDVTVENVGNQDVTSDINVTLTDDTDVVTIGAATISGLAAGASTTLTYSWNTGSASLGDHALTASHDFADDNTTNDSRFTTVTVNEAPVLGAAPVVDACSPDNGNPGGRLTVAVTGSNFQDGATADFGERVTVQGVTFVSSSQLDVRIKVHRRAGPGPRDVTVTNPDAQSGTKAGCFSVAS